MKARHRGLGDTQTSSTSDASANPNAPSLLDQFGNWITIQGEEAIGLPGVADSNIAANIATQQAADAGVYFTPDQQQQLATTNVQSVAKATEKSLLGLLTPYLLVAGAIGLFIIWKR